MHRRVNYGTPSPEGYVTAAIRLGIAPAGCLVLEDAPAELAAAAAAGMRAPALETTHSPADLGEAEMIAPAVGAMGVRVARLGGVEVLRVTLGGSLARKALQTRPSSG